MKEYTPKDDLEAILLVEEIKSDHERWSRAIQFAQSEINRLKKVAFDIKQ